MINDDYDYDQPQDDLDEEDLVIAAAATATFVASICAMAFLNKRRISIPSSTSASSSKRKRSALGEDDSTRSTELDEVKESFDMISNSLRDLASNTKRRRLQLDASTDAGHEQEGIVKSPQRRYEAMQRVKQIETHLDASRLTALADLVATDTNAADLYMSIKREDVRQAWVALKLKQMGFIEGILI